jgi:hypothetical protein
MVQGLKATLQWHKLKASFLSQPSLPIHCFSTYNSNPCSWGPLGYCFRKKHPNGRITFYYAVDLNLPRVASAVKQQFLGSRSDPIFCPPTAEWVVCPTTTYHPHQNECGAQAVLHGIFIAYHPNPHKNMLMPLMHPNLACNTRAWIAHTIMQEQFFLATLQSFYNLPQCISNDIVLNVPAECFPVIPQTWPSTLWCTLGNHSYNWLLPALSPAAFSVSPPHMLKHETNLPEFRPYHPITNPTIPPVTTRHLLPLSQPLLI